MSTFAPFPSKLAIWLMALVCAMAICLPQLSDNPPLTAEFIEEPTAPNEHTSAPNMSEIASASAERVEIGRNAVVGSTEPPLETSKRIDSIEVDSPPPTREPTRVQVDGRQSPGAGRLHRAKEARGPREPGRDTRHTHGQNKAVEDNRGRQKRRQPPMGTPAVALNIPYEGRVTESIGAASAQLVKETTKLHVDRLEAIHLAPERTRVDASSIDACIVAQLRWLSTQLVPVALKEWLRTPMSDPEFFNASITVATLLDLMGDPRGAALVLEKAEHLVPGLQTRLPLQCLSFQLVLMELHQRLGERADTVADWAIVSRLVDDVSAIAADFAPRRAQEAGTLVRVALDLGRDCCPPKDLTGERWYLDTQEWCRYVVSGPIIERIKGLTGPDAERLMHQMQDLEMRILDDATTPLGQCHEGATLRLLKAEREWNQLADEVVRLFGHSAAKDLCGDWQARVAGTGAWLVSIRRVGRPESGSGGRTVARSGDYYLAHLLKADGTLRVTELALGNVIEELLESWRFWSRGAGSIEQMQLIDYVLGGAVRITAFDPILAALDGESEDVPLHLSLHGAIQEVPFGSLPMAGQNPVGQSVIRSGEVRTISRLSQLGTAPVPFIPQGAAARALIVSDVDFHAQGPFAAGLIPRGILAGTPREAEAIVAAAAGHDQVAPIELTGTQATVTTLRQYEGRYQTLHIASHGEAIPAACQTRQAGSPFASRYGIAVRWLASAASSGVVLSGGTCPELGLTRPPYILTGQEVRLMDMGECSLVVLATCGVRPPIHGLGWDASSLAAAWLQAGAGTVVYSLWEVDDIINAEFMGYFYGALWGDSPSPREALESAKTKMVKQGHRVHAWGGWVLMN